MKLVIASRKSDLARVQAYSVGDALREKHPALEIEYHFRESLGDINLNDPLWKMPEKGVFTVDLTQGLIEGKWDMVVHSWKDLPVDPHPQTKVVATLEREDQRDLLLIPKARFAEFMAQPFEKRHLRVLSSSPRRAHNLAPFLKMHWPEELPSLEFLTVRGNIQTRIRKLFEGQGDALILAKAAADRLMSAERDEFQATREAVATALEQAHWMLLPLSDNPTAAAQGALAIEIANDRADLATLLTAIHDPTCFANVERERALLKETGGGCHQKVGISIEQRKFGKVLSIRGEHPGGNQRHLITKERANQSIAQASMRALAPSSFFERKHLSIAVPNATGIYVSHPEALPSTWSPADCHGKAIWTAGLATWKALARRGFWVNGTDDSLGESTPAVTHLQKGLSWVKLSHTQAPDAMPVLATYELVPRAIEASLLTGHTHYFWKSFSQFQRALEIAPSIRAAHHSCGPGNTARLIAGILGEGSIHIFLNEAEWRQHLGIN